jgi:SAM-dependent methyltransferase
MRHKLAGRKPRLLDYGCAHGTHLRRFFNQDTYGYSYYGTDISETQIELARKMNPAGTFKVTNGIDIPFESETFDFVVCLGVLMYAPDLDRIYAEVMRVMKPGGFLYIREPIWVERGAAESAVYARGLKPRTIAELCDRNRNSIVRMTLSHNTFVLFLVKRQYLRRYISRIGFWKVMFVLDGIINRVLVNPVLSIEFYQNIKIRPNCVNVIIERTECITGNSA